VLRRRPPSDRRVLFLKSDKSIGPLRHAISQALQTTRNPVSSGPHVELLNLGPPQIYTTNFDNLIEGTFRALKQPVEVVALPKHVANSSGAKTQVVKYHGDLRHESTLVLTESSYYQRLDFESPMDLKFRSDLLGRSVLFMGYSFRDINIRIIWFKLMRMMKDIPLADRPSSFIVRFSPNAVLERLYEEVGIKTIFLDPEGAAKTSEEKSKLLSQFMLSLSTYASPSGVIPGQTGAQFFSNALYEAARQPLEDAGKLHSRLSRFRTSRAPRFEFLEIASKRRLPEELNAEVITLLELCARRAEFDYLQTAVPLAINYANTFGPAPVVTFLVCVGVGRRTTRDILLKEENWKTFLTAKLSPDHVERLLAFFASEISHHENTFADPDYDIAYLTDSVFRMLSGEVYAPTEETVKRGSVLIQRASKLYATIADYASEPGTPPKPKDIIAEIDRAVSAKNAEDLGPPEDEDVPF
jgi:hypothetical protein